MNRFCGSLPARGLRLRALALAMLAPVAIVTAAAGWAQTSAIPVSVATDGKSLGLESPSATVTAAVWLPLHNRAEMDAELKQLYTKGSPTYHKWLTHDEVQQRFAPTAAEAAAVKAELAAHHLTVIPTQTGNYAVKFSGQVADFESAFHTQLNRYELMGVERRFTTAKPELGGAAAGLTGAVSGYDGGRMEPLYRMPRDPATGKQTGRVAVSSAKPDGLAFSSQCIYPATTVTLPGTGSASAVYTGLVYGAPQSNTAYGTLTPCGYSPQNVWQLYGLVNFYGDGYQGQGQTVVTLDAYGSPTLAADYASFSSAYGLPAPTAANFNVYTSGTITAKNTGWIFETTLDVEWLHALAPKAGVAVVLTPDDSIVNLQLGLEYAIENSLGLVISNSYGYPEREVSSYDLGIWDDIVKVGSLQGIAVNVASGDAGDEQYVTGYVDVLAPADSPSVTAIGGTSMVFSPADGSVIQTGWGNNLTRLSYSTGQVFDPPQELNGGFQGGSGGGISAFWPKPTWQSGLTGNGRHMPDIAALADPNTGVEIIITDPDQGGQYFQLIGGTSLASPIFSSMWTLLDQYTGTALGQAAPYIAAGSPLLIDVYPLDGLSVDVQGSITDNNGTTQYGPASLAQPLENTTDFVSALSLDGSNALYVLTFGTDSSLTVTPGWDNVTGYGTPSFAIFGPPGP